MTESGIELATFRLVVPYLNQLLHSVPRCIKKLIRLTKQFYYLSDIYCKEMPRLMAGSSSVHLGMLRDVSANSFWQIWLRANPVLMVP